jgi:hypothetical protein
VPPAERLSHVDQLGRDGRKVVIEVTAEVVAGEDGVVIAGRVDRARTRGNVDTGDVSDGDRGGGVDTGRGVVLARDLSRLDEA